MFLVLSRSTIPGQKLAPPRLPRNSAKSALIEKSRAPRFARDAVQYERGKRDAERMLSGTLGSIDLGV